MALVHKSLIIPSRISQRESRKTDLYIKSLLRLFLHFLEDCVKYPHCMANIIEPFRYYYVEIRVV